MNLTGVTIAFNTAATGGGGIFSNTGATANLRNTLIAKNTNSAAPDFSGVIASTGTFNLIGDGTGMTGITGVAAKSKTDSLTVDSSGNQVGTSANPIDPMLDTALKLNGGATQNHALLPNSPAIDQGSDTTNTTDQRGFTRPVDLAAYPTPRAETPPTSAHLNCSPLLRLPRQPSSADE